MTLIVGELAATAARSSSTKSNPGGAGMTDEEAANVAKVRQHHAELSAGALDEAAAGFSEPTSNHGRHVPRAVMTAILRDIRTTFPDLNMPIEALVASGDTVIVRCRFAGTHLGVGKLPVNGGLLIGVPPTGKRMDVQHIHWYIFRDGLIVEHWANRDDVGMMQQLGLLPRTEFDAAEAFGPQPR